MLYYYIKLRKTFLRIFRNLGMSYIPKNNYVKGDFFSWQECRFFSLRNARTPLPIDLC